MQRDKKLAILFGLLSALFLAGIITCFVLRDEKHDLYPQHICTMVPGECYDKLVDGGVVAAFKVNITVDNCARSEVVEMWLKDVNCAGIKPDDTTLTDGIGHYDIGGTTCYTRADDACAWDHGVYLNDIDSPLLASGITMITLFCTSVIAVTVFLCSLYCDCR